MHFKTVFYTQHPNQGNLIQLEGNSLTREPPESTSFQGTGFGKGDMRDCLAQSACKEDLLFGAFPAECFFWVANLT